LDVQKVKPAVVSPEETSGAKKVTVNLANRVRALKRLERYERRALSRRKSAMRAFDAGRFGGAASGGSMSSLTFGRTNPIFFNEINRGDSEDAGVEFIDENGGGPGVRLRDRTQKKPRK
jgi:hypothetical protein